MGEGPQPLVSVVTPVYNGGEYLAECIESVLRQTYEHFEHVISDNRSTDDSLAIARSYARRDPRLRVIAHDEHLSHHLQSWNRSMREISPDAKYVKVVHADDWLFESCLEQMVALAEAHPSVGLVSAYRLDEDRVSLDGLPPDITVLPGREVVRSQFLGGPYPSMFGSPSSTLLRADLVRKREQFYFEGNIHADLEACVDVLGESDFGFVHAVLTYTRRHNEAVTAFNRRVGTYVPSDLGVFQRWGSVFLTDEEYDRKLFVRMLGYAGFLVGRAGSWRSGEFRDWHRQRLKELLGQTSVSQLVRGARLQLRRTLARG
jgi:glycosyltransferase involved in cell wall biosynthesis